MGNAMSYRRVVHNVLLGTLACAPCVGLATPVLVSGVVSLNDPVYGPAGPDTVTVGSPVPSIQFGDTTNIGSTVLLPGEYINVATTSLIYHFEGGAAPDCPVAGYSCTGYGAGATYDFTNLVFSDPSAFIEGVSVVLTDATGISLGDGVSFTADSVSMGVGDGQLGAVSHNNGTQDFGTVELDLTLGTSTTTPVPEPATGGLFAFGLLYLLSTVRRRR